MCLVPCHVCKELSETYLSSSRNFECETISSSGMVVVSNADCHKLLDFDPLWVYCAVSFDPALTWVNNTKALCYNVEKMPYNAVTCEVNTSVSCVPQSHCVGLLDPDKIQVAMIQLCVSWLIFYICESVYPVFRSLHAFVFQILC